MSASHTDHATDEIVPHHDPAEEIAHAKHHALQNIGWFAGFFSLILLAVINYFYSGVHNTWMILGLAAGRSLLIAAFFVWLIGHYSFVVKTIVFTFFFFLGMIFLSMWDSTLPHWGNPIALPSGYEKTAPANPTAP